MTHEEIKKKVFDVVNNAVAPYEEISEDSRFKTDLGTDSLDDMEILLQLEDVFGIRITDYEAGEINTVGDAIKLVEGKL